MASVLMEYEMLYHRSWCRAIESVKSGMHAALLIKHPESKDLFVNLDPAILELIQEAKYVKVSTPFLSNISYVAYEEYSSYCFVCVY